MRFNVLLGLVGVSLCLGQLACKGQKACNGAPVILRTSNGIGARMYSAPRETEVSVQLQRH